ncbi:MAG: hypothetical protein ACYCSA_01540 [Thermoplasmataceae archaeon]
MKERAPSGRRELKPMEIPQATFEVGSSLRDRERRSLHMDVQFYKNRNRTPHLYHIDMVKRNIRNGTKYFRKSVKPECSRVGALRT